MTLRRLGHPPTPLPPMFSPMLPHMHTVYHQPPNPQRTYSQAKVRVHIAGSRLRKAFRLMRQQTLHDHILDTKRV